MAYTILNTDGTTLLLLADGKVDEVTTSISLIGKNVNSYGKYINNNFIKVLANSANDDEPQNPLTGQLWYDTGTQRLKVYDGEFRAISGAIIGDAEPDVKAIGDLWFDLATNQLKIYVNQSFFTVGPAYPKTVGATGVNIPATVIKNNELNSQQVALVQNYGVTLGMLSNTAFTMDPVDSNTYLNSFSTSTLVRGLNVFGDIQFTGQITNKTLSMNVDIVVLTPSNKDVTSPTDLGVQNTAITDLLTKMFPVGSPTTATDDRKVPLGTEARVLVAYPNPASGSVSNSYHVRRYKVVPDTLHGNVPIWASYTIYSSGTSNIVP